MEKTLMALTMLFQTIGTSAELEVLRDTGATTSALPYYRNVKKPEAINVTIPPIDAQPVTLERFFPISTSMTISEPFALEKGLPIPIFLIGLDDYSLEWLELNIDYLKSIGARGVVVSGESYADFIRVQAIVQGAGVILTIGPTNDALAKAYELESYPVLIL